MQFSARRRRSFGVQVPITRKWTAGRRIRQLVTATAAGLLVTGLLQVSSPAYAVDSPGALVPSGETSSNTPTLSWSRPAGAVRFEVRVDNDSDLSSPSVQASTTNTKLVPTKALAGGQQYWEVCAIASDNSRACSSTDFNVSPVDAPHQLSPMTGSEPLVQPQDPPLLRWEPVQGAEQYVVQVDKEADEVDVKEYKTRTTSLVVPDPLEATSYFWRVKAIRGTGVESDFSPWQEFESPRVSWRLDYLDPAPAGTGVSG